MKHATGKAAYVLRQPSDGEHTCHWPGCAKVVRPAMFACKPHWFRLPSEIRDRIWKTYRPGQEIHKNPNAEYLQAARAALAWISAQDPVRAKPAQGDLYGR